MRVVVDWYEYGYDDVSPKQFVLVEKALNTGKREWKGNDWNLGTV